MVDGHVQRPRAAHAADLTHDAICRRDDFGAARHAEVHPEMQPLPGEVDAAAHAVGEGCVAEPLRKPPRAW